MPLARKAGRARRSRKPVDNEEGDGDEEEVDGLTASKRARVDAGEQVKQLFSAAAPVCDQFQKKLVFKLAGNLAGSQGKTTVDAVWKKYMGLPDRESTRKGTNEPLINSRDELIQIIEACERDNLVMYAAEDSQIIMI